MIWLLSSVSWADCTWVDHDDIIDVPAPAVVVLGERHGMRTDLHRAHAVVESLVGAGF